MKRLREESLGAVMESSKTLMNGKELAMVREQEYYRKVIHCFLKKLFYRLVTTGVKIKLPGVGILQVCKYKVEDLNKKNISEGKKPRNFVNFRALQKMRTEGKEPEKYPTMSFKNTNGYWWTLHWNKTRAYFSIKTAYNMYFSNSNIKPNSVNKKMPEVHVSTFFRDKGYITYRELNLYYRNDKNETNTP